MILLAGLKAQAPAMRTYAHPSSPPYTQMPGCAQQHRLRCRHRVIAVSWWPWETESGCLTGHLPGTMELPVLSLEPCNPFSPFSWPWAVPPHPHSYTASKCSWAASLKPASHTWMSVQEHRQVCLGLPAALLSSSPCVL